MNTSNFHYGSTKNLFHFIRIAVNFLVLEGKKCLINKKNYFDLKILDNFLQKSSLCIYQRVKTISYPVGIYLLKFNNKNTRARCEICSTLTIKTPEQRHSFIATQFSSVYTVNFEHVIAG